jgi:hypothetical protein
VPPAGGAFIFIVYRLEADKPHEDVQSDHSFSDRAPTTARDRQAQLLKAAERVHAWVSAQRAAWTEAGLRPQVDGRLPALQTVGTISEPALVFAPPAAPDPVVPPEQPARSANPKVARAAAATLRWGLRGAAVAAGLALIAFAGSKGWTYWSAWRNAPAIGTAILESDPPGSLVWIDGVAIGAAPVTTELPAGQHRVEFRRRAEKRSLTIDVVKGRSTNARLDWSVVPTGRVEASSDPAGARVIVDGRDRGVTPLTIDVTVGPHVVVLKSDRGSVKKTVTVQEATVTLVNEALFSGWIRVASPIDLGVREANKRLALDERHEAMIAPGPHDLQLENRALGFLEARHVEITAGETTTISITPPLSTLTLSASEAAEVMVDGERAGETPLTNHPVSIGTRSIIVRSASGAERQLTLTVTTAPAVASVDFSKP